jgi:hypothetical protein
LLNYAIINNELKIFVSNSENLAFLNPAGGLESLVLYLATRRSVLKYLHNPTLLFIFQELIRYFKSDY